MHKMSYPTYFPNPPSKSSEFSWQTESQVPAQVNGAARAVHRVSKQSKVLGSAVCFHETGDPQNGVYTCAWQSTCSPDPFLCANRSDLSSRALKALLTDIVSHTAQSGAVIPHQDRMLHFRRVATVDLCNGK